MPFILGTAGHIDHGKTTLVRALTGMDCDRLDEEKRRGITIDLGFAWLDLPGGERLGIVDVPGHERFVKTMVAGAAGIDLVMLVIAADEGVMPQTREHLEICSLLGVRQGFTVLTKTDLVDADWLSLVREDVAGFLKGSFLEGEPVFAVSTVTGEGMAQLASYIASRVGSLPPPRRADIFRLPVDRIFTLKGHGTIVTGTVVSGHTANDVDAVLAPSMRRVHIRSLQRHGASASEIGPGVRCAANLLGVEVDEVERGSTLALPGTLFPSKRWVVRLECLASSPLAVRDRTEVHFHHATAAVAARLRLLGRPRLAPGETCLAEALFAGDMTGVFGDRFVIRASVPLRAVAGGALLSPLPPTLHRREARTPRRLELLEALSRLVDEEGHEQELVATVLELREDRGATLAELKALTALPTKRLEKALQALTSSHAARCFDRQAPAWVAAAPFADLCAACLKRAGELHDQDPLRPGHAPSALAAGWGAGLSPRLVQNVFSALLADGRLESTGEALRLPGRGAEMDADTKELSERLLALYAGAGIAPPTMLEVCAALAADEKAIAPALRVLADSGKIEKVAPGLYYAARALEDIRTRVATWFADHDDLTVADMKAITGLSRKFLIPLLEYLDQKRITVRIGDKRQFRGRLEQPSS